MKKNLKEVAKLFKETRKMLGISQTQFGNMIDMSQVNICRIEKEVVNPPGSVTLLVLKIKNGIKVKK